MPLSGRALLAERIDLRFILGGGLLLFALQLMCGTSGEYALLILVFVIMTGMAINQLGGIREIGGFCMAVLALKMVIISQVVKVVMGQPGDSFLTAPTTTAAVLALGVTGMHAAGLVVSRIRFREVLLQPVTDADKLGVATIITYATGVTTYIYVNLFGAGEAAGTPTVGGFLGVARSLQLTLALSMVLGLAYTLTASQNRRSLGPLSVAPMLTYFLFGAIGATKFGMLGPFLAYFLTCWSFGFRFRSRHLVALATVAVFAATVVFPFAQFGRAVMTSANLFENAARTLEYAEFLVQPNNYRYVVDTVNAYYESKQQFLYYGRPMGLIDRFTMMATADKLVGATEQQGISGWDTIEHGFQMVLPRAVYAGKPIHNTANDLGRKAGFLGEADQTTQVSFGFIAESFSAFSWTGAVLIPFILTTIFFVAYKKLVGGLDGNVWAVFLFYDFQHAFVEATISSMILMITQTTVILLLLQFLLRTLSSTFLLRAKAEPALEEIAARSQVLR